MQYYCPSLRFASFSSAKRKRLLVADGIARGDTLGSVPRS